MIAAVERGWTGGRDSARRVQPARLLARMGNVALLQRFAGNQAVVGLIQRNTALDLMKEMAFGVEDDAADAPAGPAPAPIANLTDEQCKALVDDCGKSWKRVQDRYAYQEGGAATMRRLLKYREDTTSALIAYVKEQIKAQFGPKAAIESFFAGSTDLTSDIDMTIISQHPKRGPEIEVAAITRFNARFRELLGAEAGTYFDVNLYARDFIPQKVGRINKEKLAKKRARLKQVNDLLLRTPTDPALLEEKAALETRIGVIETQANRITTEGARGDSFMSTAERDRQLQAIDDVMSLVKLRRYMSADAWGAHMRAAMAEAPDLTTRNQIVIRYTQADDLWRETKTAIDTKILALNQDAYPRIEGVRDRVAFITRARGDAEMQATNRLYEETLNEVVRLGQQIAAIKREVLAFEGIHRTQQAALDRLTKAYLAAKTKALVFANESYHTGGALKDVVLNRQSGFGVTLSVRDYLQSVHEQAGFIAEQVEGPDNARRAGQAFWKVGKYVDRLCSAIADIKKEVVKTQPTFDITSLPATLQPLALRLLTIKKMPEAWLRAGAARTAAGEAGYDSPERLLEVVLEVNREADAKVRPLLTAAAAAPA
jgi:hypothetical protein